MKRANHAFIAEVYKMKKVFDLLDKVVGGQLEQYMAMQYIQQQQNSMTMTELRNKLSWSPARVTKLTNAMEDQGLASKQSTKEDRRLVFIHLTLAGIKKSEEMDVMLDTYLDGFIGSKE